MRITGGVFRSRLLTAPRGDATRPTSDRVREALFAILGGGAALARVRVLDLYAGSGALALEALSRGASSATLVEPARAAIDAIQTNVQALGVGDRTHVLAAPVERAHLSLRSGPFDLVFADPPYAQVASGQAPRAIAALLARPPSVLAPGARLVLEHSKADPAPALPGLSFAETRRYGDTSLSFYDVADAEDQGRG
jgi:16S rRNA (guanine966-N2)-methyltransferase